MLPQLVRGLGNGPPHWAEPREGVSAGGRGLQRAVDLVGRWGPWGRPGRTVDVHLPSQVPLVPGGRPTAPRLPHQLLHSAGAARQSPARGHRAVPDPHGDDQGGPEELPGAHLQRARGRRADQGAAWFQQEAGPQERQGEEAGLQGGLRAAGPRTDLHVPRSLPREEAEPRRRLHGGRPRGAAGGAATEAAPGPPAGRRPPVVRPVTATWRRAAA